MVERTGGAPETPSSQLRATVDYSNRPEGCKGFVQKNAPKRSHHKENWRRHPLGYAWLASVAILQLWLLSPGLSYTIHTSPRRFSFQPLSTERVAPPSPRSGRSSRLFSTPNSNTDPSTFKALLSALALYKAAYENVNVPESFIVPNLAPWPEPAHGMALGKAVAEWKSGAPLSAAQVRALQQLGMIDLNSNTSAQQQSKPRLTWSLLVTAVQRYQAEVKANQIPVDFVVPATWEPAAIQGLPLGAQVRALAQNPAFADRVAKLGVIVVDTVEEEEEEEEDEILAEVEVQEKPPPEETLPSSSTDQEGDIGISASESYGDNWSSDEGTSKGTTEVTSETAHVEEHEEEADMTENKDPGPEETESPKPSASEGADGGSIEVPTVQSLVDNHKGRLSANDKRFYMVYAALANYRKLYGDLMVPQPFVVPSQTNRWPEDLWGIRLGARVNAIRSQGTFVNNYPDRRGQLDKLGFIWSPPKAGDRRGRVPSRYADSDDEDGDDNGKSTGALESIFGGSFDFGPGSTDFMSAIDGGSSSTDAPPPSTSWDLDSAKVPERARRTAEEKEKAQRRSEEYVPPRTLRESLEEATERALEVGIISGMTENKRVIKGKRVKNIPWYNDDFGDDFVFEDVVEALTFYKNKHGDFSNFTEECDFVVPVREQVTGFLEQDTPDDIDFFSMEGEEMPAAFAGGGGISESNLNEEDFITAEIQRLQREVGQGGFDGLTTPDGTTGRNEDDRDDKSGDDGEWPEHLGGMALGHIVRRIKDGSLEVKHLPERKKVLDDIDFDWGDPLRFLDIPFEKALCAFYAYYLVRGDMFVEEDFIMPGDDPWPEVLAGYEIGKAVKRVRELQNFFEAYHPEKLSVLRRIDFLWFPATMALPIDPNEPEASKESIFLTAFGHPDYAKMRYSSMPLELPNQISADGPYDEPEDVRHWWRKWHNWDYVKDIWYAHGRRDNAYALRKMGYPQIAAEHEAKYGPGLFQQINTTMSELKEKGVDRLDDEEKQDVIETLSHFLHELTNCTDLDPDTLDALILDIEKHENATKLGVPVDELENESVTVETEEAGGYEEEEVEDDYDEDGDGGDVATETVDSVEVEEVEDDDDEDDSLTDVNTALGL